jgi:pSer/pThr/pTyr-binding forkhead associated (FHA) protein
MGPVSRPNLIVEEGPIQGEEIELTCQELIIGRDLIADLAIPSPFVSHQHATQEKGGSSYPLKFLSSATNLIFHMGAPANRSMT